MAQDMLSQIRTRGVKTPVHVQADPRQVRNATGGWGFAVSDETRIRRFLTMGTYGTYYASAEQVTADNGGLVLDWAQHRSASLVALAREISAAGRAPRNGPALLAVAAALGLGDVEGRRAAAAAVNDVARTGSHLEQLAKYAGQFGGWGPLARRAFAGWYLGKDEDALAYQMVKYRRRGGDEDGWSHADILKMAHPKPRRADGTLMEGHNRLFAWAAGRDHDAAQLPAMVHGYMLAQDIGRGEGTGESKAKAYVQLLRDYPGLPWEALPDEATGQPDVWRALIEAGLPVTALIRNLVKLTRLGVLAPMSAHLAAACARLRDGELLRKGRVHPVQILIAMKTYATGVSNPATRPAGRPPLTWAPVPQVLDALSDAFYLAFPAVEPAGKRTMINLDISSSMGSSAAGYNISAREVCAAMAAVVMATEPAWGVYGFSHQFIPLQISAGMRLDTLTRAVSGLPFGSTDPSLPARWALANKVEVDTFQVWTDYEVNTGPMHPFQALEAYRQGMGIDARMQFIATTPVQYSLGDPGDPRHLDVSGFDADVPVLLANHSAGRL